MHDGLKLLAELQLQSPPRESNAVSIVTEMHSKVYVASTYHYNIPVVNHHQHK